MSETVVNAMLAIALAVISGVLSVIGVWAKAKYGSEKLQQWDTQAETIVRAAEQIGALYGWDGARKKEYAVALMVQAGVEPDMAEAFIESAVKGLIAWQGEMVAGEPGHVVKRTAECPLDAPPAE